MGHIGPTELIIIAAVIVLLFGRGRIANIGGEMGSAIREFRKGLKETPEESTPSENK
ncbi:MAG: twin-arginine translocase TatA/TatE family subunit [Anaerolineae bacterium]|nr:twin-arginine translocase TatA/TatE family subunit [Anaerolineae bacterium]